MDLRKHRWLAAALLLSVPLLLGSGTGGARGSHSRGSSILIPAGHCPGWQVIPSPSPGAVTNSLYGVAAASPTAAWAVGQADGAALLARWNGRGWQVVPNPYAHQTQTLYGVSAVSATDVWAVGNYFTLRTRTTLPLALHGNGGTWQQVPMPAVGVADTLTGVAALSASDVWAVGYTSTVFDVTSTLIEHWDGTSWQVVPSPNGGADANDLYGVAAVAARDVWAVGEAVVPHTGPSQPLLERWDGMRWQVVAGPIPGKIYNTLQGVTVIPGTSRLWAVGAYANTGPGPSETLTELYC